ncbi:MAG TPA: TraB/GumN family protein [Verrucomicrobiae bacterium]|nr:TraB/GumN family protein [Verrucomicrobiae bacterium]
MKQRFARIGCTVLAGMVLSGAVLAQGASTNKQHSLFLWKVTAAKGTAYLLGSIHAAKPDLYPLNPQIEQAFATSDVLVVEANVGDAQNLLGMLGQTMAQGMYPSDDNIEKHLAPATMTMLTNALDKLGLPLTFFESCRPWFLAMTIPMLQLQQAGFTAENGLDMHFITEANATQKPILELEGGEAQIQLMSGLSSQEQELLLESTIEQMDTTIADVEKVIAAWRRGDAAAIDKLMNHQLQEEPKFKPIFKKLIEDRNRGMAEKLAGYLNTSKTYFVVVGAGHLVGQDGLVHLLAQKYKVMQM